MINFKKKRLTFSALLILTVSACSDGQTNAEPVDLTSPYEYKTPAYTDDGWQVGHLGDFGFDQSQITPLIRQIENGTFPGIESISIVRNNTLLLHKDFRTSFSQYDNWIGNDQLDHHVMHSTSKSFVSTLVGIAIEQGYIQDSQVPFYDFFDYPEYDNWTPEKQSITLENALTMQLGIEWDEWSHPYTDERNSLVNIVNNNHDYIKALLDLPLTSQPGELYAYNTAASIALGLVVENSTGIALEDYAEEYLFAPMQFEDAKWLMTPTDLPNAGSGLFLRTRDMAKFGQLYLDQGVWNGMQIINSDWIEKSLQHAVILNWDFTTGYGYQWWLGSFSADNKLIPFYSTRGYGGQFIVIVPEYELVVAFTGNNYENDLYASPFNLVEDYILPAIVL